MFPNGSAQWYQKWKLIVLPKWKRTVIPKWTPIVPDWCTTLKKNNRCWLDHFVPALEQRMPLIRGPDRLTSLKKISIDAVNDFDIDICLAVGFIHFRCFLCPIDEIDDIPWKFDCGPVNFYTQSQSCRCFHRRDLLHHRYYKDRCLVGKPHCSTTVRHKYYCLDVAHLIFMFYSNGNRSQIPSIIHIDFYVFTWPGDLIQRWFVTL